MEQIELLRLATEARANAYAPYSGYRVGAALLAEDGRVFCGCNVENASYTPTCCAERVAILKAVSEGCRRFTAIAVVGGKDDADASCVPCGVCRQVLAEFCGDGLEIMGVSSDGEVTVRTLGALLPDRFAL